MTDDDLNDYLILRELDSPITREDLDAAAQEARPHLRHRGRHA